MTLKLSLHWGTNIFMNDYELPLNAKVSPLSLSQREVDVKGEDQGLIIAIFCSFHVLSFLSHTGYLEIWLLYGLGFAKAIEKK